MPLRVFQRWSSFFDMQERFLSELVTTDLQIPSFAQDSIKFYLYKTNKEIQHHNLNHNSKIDHSQLLLNCMNKFQILYF